MHDRQTGPVQRLLGEPVQLVLRARGGFGNAHLRESHLRHIDERLHAVMLRHRRRIDRRGQIGIRNRHAEVHRLAAGNHPMHRIEIEEIADHDLRTHVAQRLRAFVFISHHRTHRFALLQQQFGDRAPYRANAARRAGDQNGICHVFSSYAFTLNRKCSILFAKRGVSYRLHQRPDGSLLNHSRQTHSGLTARG